jgi:hypothetical protein
MVGAWGKCVESAWVRELKVLGKFGGKGLGMRAWKVAGFVGIESIDSLKSLNIARKARRQLNVF